MTVVPLINPRSQFFDDNGDPLAGGFVYFYSAGTLTPKDTYTSSTGLTANSNPVELDSAGRAAIWGTGSYKVIVKDALGATISTDDNYTAAFASTANQFADDVLIVTDNSDVTKKFRFEASGISAGQTRVYTVPNASTTLVGTDVSQTLTNKTLVAPTISQPVVTLKTEQSFAVGSSVDFFAYDTPRILLTGSGATITDFGTSGASVGQDFTVRFDGVNTITHNGTNLILPEARDIVTAAGDIMVVRSGNSGGWRVISYKRSTALATYQATPANPTGTNNTTGLMMGLAGAFTPTRTGNCMIIISGDMTNGTASSGSKVQIRYGTGSAPANAAALTGTAVGNLVRYVGLAGSTTLEVPFTCNAVVTGLTVGTAIWLDIGLASITSGTAAIKDVSISVIELP